MSEPREKAKGGVLGPAVAVALVFCALVGLGVWQLQRLAWKEGVIAHIAARIHQPPEPAPPRTEWAALRPEDYDYRHIRIVGRYVAGSEALIFRSSGPAREDRTAGPGYQVLAPFALSGGGIVLVDRGFAPLAWKDQPALRTAPPSGEVEVAGLMRPPEERNLFTPADEPDKGIWFSRDPASVAAKLGLKDVAPFTLDVDAASGAKGWPHAGATELNIPNNHLSYALTWFGLACTLAGVFGVWAWGRRRAGSMA